MKSLRSVGSLGPLLFMCLVMGCVRAQASPLEADSKARLAKAEAMFAERCKTAGEFIHRTVDDVEAIFLMKLRPEGINYGDQFRIDDPYGSGIRGKGYVATYLYGRNSKGSFVESGEVVKGYRYVDAIDPADGQRYRYTGAMKVVGKKDSTATNVKLNLQRDPNYDLNIYSFTFDKVPAPGAPPRYGVTFDDLSTREEREHWIAGSSLKVIDLKTNEVMAERIGYLMDPRQGEKGGGRAPWLLAAEVACPKFPQASGTAFRLRENRDFVEKVLRPKQGN